MIDSEQAQKLKLALASSGWNDVIKPALEKRMREGVKALVLTRAERAARYKGTDFDADDEVLRAMIRESEWMVFSWHNELAVSEHNRQLDELDRQNAGANP